MAAGLVWIEQNTYRRLKDHSMHEFALNGKDKLPRGYARCLLIVLHTCFPYVHCVFSFTKRD